jgi:transcriptional regulator with XRE-family HTH domain
MAAAQYTRLVFGIKVKLLRQERQLSFADFAERCGLSVSYLNEIEKGKKYPKEDKILDIAKALEVEPEALSSTRLPKHLQPLADLLRSQLLDDLSLDIFDIDISKVVDIISDNPGRVSAFISALMEISRKYEVHEENFYFAALRSYQKLYDNYFEDLEIQVDTFVKTFGLPTDRPIGTDRLYQILREDFKYKIDKQMLDHYPELRGVRSVLIPQKKRLLLYSDLSPMQEKFVLSKELGYSFMKIKERVYTSNLLQVSNFEQVLNNFKSSYFAVALLINRERLVTQLKGLFNRSKWSPDAFLDIMLHFQASPEMFFQRLSNILPKYFGLNDMFFLRFNHTPGTEHFYLTKELHLSRQHLPYGNETHEHYCRRWATIWLLKDLHKLQQNADSREAILGIQRSRYIGTEDEYLVITLARSGQPTPNTNVSVSIGLAINEHSRQIIKFIDDHAIPLRMVNQTCERCPATDCHERAAAPSIVERDKAQQVTLNTLNKLLEP